MTTDLWRNIGAGIVRWRTAVCVFWIAAAVALVPLGRDLEQRLQVRAEIDGSDSGHADAILNQNFSSLLANTAIVTVTGIGALDSAQAKFALGEVVKDIAATSGVTETRSYLGTGDHLFVGENGSGTYILVGVQTGTPSEDATIAALRESVRAAQEKLSGSFPQIALRVTGASALSADLRLVSAEQARTAELWAMPIVLGLLLFAFGNLRVALLPAISGPLAIALALGIIGALSRFWGLSILITNVVTMIGLGLSIDYALVMVSRFKEAHDAGARKELAAVAAAHHAGKTIVISGIAVAIGFAGLLLMPLNELRSIAVGGVVVAATAILIALTLVPSLLSWLGKRGKVHSRRTLRESTNFWSWWGSRVALYPKRVLFCTALPLLLLSIAATRISTEVPRDDWLPQGAESVRALHDLKTMGRHSIIETIRVIVQLPVPVESEPGWRAITRSAELLGADPRVAQIRSIVSAVPDTAAIPSLSEALRHSLISSDHQSALLEIVPRESSSRAELLHFARAVRVMGPVALTGLPGTLLSVGGIPAFDSEYVDAVTGRLPTIILLVVLGTFVIFAFAYRSILIPVKAIVLNLLSVSASLGAAVLVFQDGYGASFFGVEAPVGGVFPIIPALVFCTVFGLSIDYEAFLLSRLVEARNEGSDDPAALRQALACTGRVITSAALIMMAVFAAFMLGDFVLIKMLGFALVAAVAIDATIVRLGLGPALIIVSGRWNWWPGERLQTRHAPAVTIAQAVSDV